MPKAIFQVAYTLLTFFPDKVNYFLWEFPDCGLFSDCGLFAQPHTIVCCGASIVAHFARKVRATNT